jgi:hypothetical protein
MTSATLYLPGIHELQTLLRELPVRIHARRMILLGQVLDNQGEWVGIRTALADRREIETHLERGEVLRRGNWVAVEEALAEEAATAKSPRRHDVRPAAHAAPTPAPHPDTPAPAPGPVSAELPPPAPTPVSPEPPAVRPEPLPLIEGVKSIIAYYGPGSLLQLRKRLREERFGGTRIGPLGLYFALKSANLETHAKRVRYFRSC